MNGYVIEATEAGFLLDRNGWWTAAGRSPETGYVHTTESVRRLLQGCSRWELKPAWAYPARWTPQGTQIIGSRIPFMQVLS